MNYDTQIYKTIPLKLIDRKDYPYRKAKRYSINKTSQNVWIPNRHLKNDGTIKPSENIDYVFNTKHGLRKLELAGVKVNLNPKYGR